MKTYDEITENRMKVKIKTVDGYRTFDAIGRTLIDNELIKLTFDNGEYVIATDDHQFYLEKDEKITTSLVHIGERLFCTDDVYVTVQNKETVQHNGYIYDVINVDGTHSFVVGDMLLNTSNCVVGESKSKFRNKKTGEVVEMSMFQLKQVLMVSNRNVV